MIASFADRGTQDIFDGIASKAARRALPVELWPRAQSKLDDLNHAGHYWELRFPPSNRLHELTGDRPGQHAIAINRQYRICFRWHGTDAYDVEITDYH